ncbi:hypothetical protein [Treponema sp.]
MESKNLKYYIRPGKMTAEHTNVDAYIMIDFSYQMNKRVYVSDAYTNFTCYNRLGSFIETAAFVLPTSGEEIPLTGISTLDRDVKKGFIRVSTILENQYVEKVLKALHESCCVLSLTFDDGSTQSFVATDDLKARIFDAFSK